MDSIQYKIYEAPMALSARGGAMKADWKKAIEKAVNSSDDPEKAEELTFNGLISSLNMLPKEDQIRVLESESFSDTLKEVADELDASGVLKSLLTTTLKLVAEMIIKIIIEIIFKKVDGES